MIKIIQIVMDKKSKLKKEKIRASAAKFRNKNIEKIREKDRELKKRWRKEHPEEYRKYIDNYNKINKDKIKARDKNRMLTQPEYFLFSSARTRAREKKIEFNITEQDIKILLDNTKLCPLRKTIFERGSNGKAIDNSRSLDRIDSTKGYIKGNIQLISYRANVIKNNLTIEEFENIITNFRCLKIEEHKNDDITRQNILSDRMKQILETNRLKSDYNRIMNIEGTILSSAKKRAKKNKIEINIDINYIRSIWPLDNKCPIMKHNFIIGKDVVSDFSATIDRIDNTKGYIKGNVCIIANKANSVKNKATLEELEFMLENWKELERKKS